MENAKLNSNEERRAGGELMILGDGREETPGGEKEIRGIMNKRVCRTEEVGVEVFAAGTKAGSLERRD